MTSSSEQADVHAPASVPAKGKRTDEALSVNLPNAVNGLSLHSPCENAEGQSAKLAEALAMARMRGELGKMGPAFHDLSEPTIEELATCRPIGRRYLTVPKQSCAGTFRQLASCLREEAARLQTCGEDSSLVVATLRHPEWGGPRPQPGKSDLARLFEACPEQDMVAHLVWTFTVHSFIHASVNALVQGGGASPESPVLAPFARLLHDALALQWGGLERYSKTVYRAMTMDDAAAARYAAGNSASCSNLFAWDGFIICHCSPEKALTQVTGLGANTLIVIESDEGRGPVDIRQVSDFGREEGEALFNTGQHFRKLGVETVPMKEAFKDVDPEVLATVPADGRIRVIRLLAVDAFFEIADDLCDGTQNQAGDSPGEEEAARELLVQLAEERHSFARTLEEEGSGEGTDVPDCLALLRRAYGRAHRLPDLRERLGAELERCCARHGDCSEQAALLHEHLGHLLMAMHLQAEGSGQLRKALEIRTQLFGANSVRLAHSHNQMGMLKMQEGDLAGALATAKEVLRLRLDGLGRLHADTAQSYANVADVYKMMGKLDEALQNQQECLSICLDALDANDMRVGEAHLNIALIYSARKERDPAIREFEAARRIYAHNRGDAHLSLATIYSGMGYLDHILHNWDEAESHYTQAMEIWEATLGPDHRNTVYARNQVATCQRTSTRSRSLVNHKPGSEQAAESGSSSGNGA